MMRRPCTYREGLDAEDGIALFYALLVTLIVAGVVAVTFASALTEQRQSAFELDFEDTLHVAEAGTEIGLQEVLGDGSVGNASDPGSFLGTEQEWAIEEAENAAASRLVQVGGGEAVWLRPSTGSTQFVYGVGFVPSRDAYLNNIGESYARVVRMEVGFTDALVPGTYAFLANRVLNFNGGGSSSIFGTNGSVHANGTFDGPPSSGFSFEGTVSFLDCTSNCSEPGYTETNTVVPINVGRAEDLYISETSRDYLTNPSIDGNGDGIGDWYDRCGGSWHLRTDPNGSPCSGPTVATVPGFTAATQGVGASGVYWFDGDVDVNMAARNVRMTIITGGDINLPSGNVSFNWLPAYKHSDPSEVPGGVHAYAGGVYQDTDGDGVEELVGGGDIHWGNVDVNVGSIDCAGGLSAAERSAAAAIDPGIVYAGNNLYMGGNPSAVQISFVAQSDVVFNGGGSRCIVLETDASGDLGGSGVPVVTEWDELN